MIAEHVSTDPVQNAHEQSRTAWADACNHAGWALTAAARALLWTLIWWLLTGARWLKVIDGKVVDRRAERKDERCQSLA